MLKWVVSKKPKHAWRACVASILSRSRLARCSACPKAAWGWLTKRPSIVACTPLQQTCKDLLKWHEMAQTIECLLTSFGTWSPLGSALHLFVGRPRSGTSVGADLFIAFDHLWPISPLSTTLQNGDYQPSNVKLGHQQYYQQYFLPHFIHFYPNVFSLFCIESSRQVMACPAVLKTDPFRSKALRQEGLLQKDLLEAGQPGAFEKHGEPQKSSKIGYLIIGYCIPTYGYLYIYIYGYPQKWMVYNGKSHKWMIWWYPPFQETSI